MQEVDVRKVGYGQVLGCWWLTDAWEMVVGGKLAEQLLPDGPEPGAAGVAELAAAAPAWLPRHRQLVGFPPPEAAAVAVGLQQRPGRRGVEQGEGSAAAPPVHQNPVRWCGGQ